MLQNDEENASESTVVDSLKGTARYQAIPASKPHTNIENIQNCNSPNSPLIRRKIQEVNKNTKVRCLRKKILFLLIRN